MKYLQYLANIGGKDQYEFNDPDEAYHFGNNLRDRIESEGESNLIAVVISNTIVRVCTTDPVFN